MFKKDTCSKKRRMVKNWLTIILLTGWQKNELSVLECTLVLLHCAYLPTLCGHSFCDNMIYSNKTNINYLYITLYFIAI